MIGDAAFSQAVSLAFMPLLACGMPPEGLSLALSESDDLDGANPLYGCLGIAVAAALLSAGFSIDVEGVAFIGEIWPSGALKALNEEAVQKAEFIIARAVAHDIRLLVTHKSLLNQKEAAKAAKKAGVEIIPVNDLQQVTEFVKDLISIREISENEIRRELR